MRIFEKDGKKALKLQNAWACIDNPIVGVFIVKKSDIISRNGKPEQDKQ
jgi:pyrimidine deaminase RibD-like protein